MKKIVAIMAAMALTSGTAFAIPYASQIQVSNPAVPSTSNQTISYVLNEEADSVTIEILDDSDAVVATFDGTTNQGANSVLWDTTVDNDDGDLVDIGEGYRVRVTASLDAPEEWYEFASNTLASAEDPETLLATIQDWWNPANVHVPRDQQSDSFGTVLTPTADLGDDIHAGALRFRSDLELAAGGSIANLVLVPDGTVTSSFEVFGVEEDPDDISRLYVTSQGDISDLFTADDPLAAELDDADPNDVVAASIRKVAVGHVGAAKRAIFATSSASPPTIQWAEVTLDHELSQPYADILASGLRPLAGIDAAFDDEGNFYWLVRSGIEGNNFGGHLMRWSAATMAAVDPDEASTLLTMNEDIDPTAPTDNADWNLIEAPGDTGQNFQERRFLSMTISPDGDVYILSRRFVYHAGNTSEPTLRGQLGAGDRIIDVTGEDENEDPLPYFGTLSSGLSADAFGNLYVADRGLSVIRGYAPGGESTTTVLAPASQTFEITDEPTAAEIWQRYE